jgi:hypothetical protein
MLLVPLSIVIFLTCDIIRRASHQVFQNQLFFFLPLNSHLSIQQQDVKDWLLTRHSVAVQIVPYDLLELMICRPLLEALTEKVSQVLVEPSSYRTNTQNKHINKRASWRSSSPGTVCEKAIHSNSSLPLLSHRTVCTGFPLQRKSKQQ